MPVVQNKKKEQVPSYFGALIWCQSKYSWIRHSKWLWFESLIYTNHTQSRTINCQQSRMILYDRKVLLLLSKTRSQKLSGNLGGLICSTRGYFWEYSPREENSAAEKLVFFFSFFFQTKLNNNTLCFKKGLAENNTNGRKVLNCFLKKIIWTSTENQLMINQIYNHTARKKYIY